MSKLGLSTIVSAVLLCGMLHAEESVQSQAIGQPINPVMPFKEIDVVNPGNLARNSETVSLCWDDIEKHIQGLSKSNFAVFDLNNKPVLTQVIECDGKTELIFQADLAPAETKSFRIMPRPAALTEPESKTRTYCRHVPERMDDFAWENDRIAFRMYGPRLWKDPVNSGIDCWLKRVDYPVIDTWYGQMKTKTYHKDWGEGNDPYHVGKSAGCGGLRIVRDGKSLYSNVYDEWKVIANGPIRSVFELVYDKSWKASGVNAVETKRVTIDLGHRLCKLESTFTGPDADSIDEFALGITTHNGRAASFTEPDGTLAYAWEKIEGYGLGTAVMVLCPGVKKPVIVTSQESDESHVFLVVENKNDSKVAYYTGYGWEKAGQIKAAGEWEAYLKQYKATIEKPAVVRFD